MFNTLVLGKKPLPLEASGFEVVARQETETETIGAHAEKVEVRSDPTTMQARIHLGAWPRNANTSNTEAPKRDAGVLDRNEQKGAKRCARRVGHKVKHD